jgi:hypothetical protein
MLVALVLVIGICILLAILGFLLPTLSRSRRATDRGRAAGKNAKLPF